MLCGRYLKNRAASVSKTIRSSSNLSSPVRKSPGGTGPGTSGNSNGSNTSTKKNYGPTAYLKGVRGIASVAVFIFHATWAYTPLVDRGYGLHGENYHLIQLPFLRLIHAGHAMVALFFLIGGYVNAVKPIKLIREQRFAELTPAVGSSLLRRGFRLYIPPMAATLITALMTWMGFLEPSRRNLENFDSLFNWPDFHPGRKDTLIGTLNDWRQQMSHMLDLWHQPFWTHYDPHLWTVPLEFRASLILSVALAAVACCRVGSRLTIMSLLTIYMIRCNRWEVALFLAGAILAELDAMRRERAKAAEAAIALGIQNDYDLEAKAEIFTKPPAEKRMSRGLGIVFLTLIGLYLLSYPPADGKETPGFVTIWQWLVPSWTDDGKRYVHGVGGVLFLIAVSSSKTLQRPFLTSTAQYLGDISYAFYIVHGPVLHTVSYVMGPAALAITGVETDNQWAMGIILTGVVNFIISLAVADVFYRFVDVGSVKVAMTFQRICTLSGY